VVRKIGHIFVTLDGKVTGNVQGVDTICCTIFMMIDLAANVAGTSKELGIDINSSKESAATFVIGAQKLLKDSKVIEKEFLTADVALGSQQVNAQERWFSLVPNSRVTPRIAS
jgi:hypothetical protein